MAKITLNPLSSLTGNETTALATINDNFSRLQTFIDTLLSRDGTSPNTLTANLDMNSKRITNLPAAVSNTEPVRKAELDAAVLGEYSIDFTFDITDYGITGTGDDTTAMNALIAQINAGTVQGIISIPAGTWITVKSALTPFTNGGWLFRHEGTRDQGGFILDYSVGTGGGDKTEGNLFQIGVAGTSQVSYWGFQNLTIKTNNYRTDDGSRWLLEVPYANNAFIDNVDVLYGHCIKWGSGTSTGGKAHIRNINLQANKSLPGAAFNMVYASGFTMLDGNMTATTRNVISDTGFASASSWTKGGDIAAVTLTGGNCAVVNTGSTSYIEQTCDLIAGTTYAIDYDVTARSAGTVTVQIVGDTTTSGTARSSVATFSENIVAPANPTKIRFLFSSTANATIDNVVVKRIVSATFVGNRVGPEIADGNIDSIGFYGYEANFPQDNDVPLCLEVDASYDDVGSVYFDRSFFEYGVDAIKIHSSNGSTGMVKNLHFHRCRATPINTGTGQCIKITNTNNVPMNILWNGGTINGARGDMVVTTCGSVATANQMSTKFSNVNIIDRAAGGGSDHPVFSVGTDGFEVEDSMLKINWNSSNVAFSSKINRFVTASAAITNIKVVGNTFTDCTNANEHIDLSAATTFGTNNNFIVANNRGITDYNWPRASIEASMATDQAITANTDTVLNGTTITIPDGCYKVGTRLRITIDVTKTAAGTATPIVVLRRGTTGTTSDTAVATLTFAAQTAAADSGTIVLEGVVTATGVNGRIRLTGRLSHALSVTGLSTSVVDFQTATNSTFDTTATGQKFCVSLNSGASAAWTIKQVVTQLTGLKGV